MRSSGKPKLSAKALLIWAGILALGPIEKIGIFSR